MRLMTLRTTRIQLKMETTADVLALYNEYTDYSVSELRGNGEE